MFLSVLREGRTDHFETLTRSWFQDMDIPAGQGDVGRAIQAAARKNCFHPLRALLSELEPQWDSQPRIDRWLITYLHSPDTPYARAIGPRFLISAVARIFDPGCKVDHMPVLEGPQGQGKSKAVRALAVRDEWYADRLSDPSSKDAAIETAGAWLIEVAEMQHKRQCVFIGTINPEGGYLKDATGSRRVWPIECQGFIDIEGLIRDRDQLWAEAVVRFKAGAKWWLETPELEALATDSLRKATTTSSKAFITRQSERYRPPYLDEMLAVGLEPLVLLGAWQEPIEQWLGNRQDVSVAEILEHVFGLEPQKQSQTAQNRVVRILTGRLHFAKHRPRKGNKDGKRKNRYYR
jgi:predicted P-loop ATPase